MLKPPLFEKQVRLVKTSTLDFATANALADESRLTILDIICHSPVNAEEIAIQLEAMGRKRSTTTVRHHLNVLISAGVIQVCRIVETRGTITKYYAPTLQSFRSPPSRPSGAATEKLICDISKKLAKILVGIFDDKRLVLVPSEKTKCVICKADHSRAAVVLNVVDVALARAVQASEFRDRLSLKEQR